MGFLNRRIAPKVSAGVTASTTQTQGQGTVSVTSGDMFVVVEVSTCVNANDTITLGATVPGRVYHVINNGAQTLRVFPASGSNFVGSVADAAVNVAAGAVSEFTCFTSTKLKKTN